MHLHDCIHVCSLKGHGHDFSKNNSDVIVDNASVRHFYLATKI